MKRKARNGRNQYEGDEGAGQAHGRTSLSGGSDWDIPILTRPAGDADPHRGRRPSSFRRKPPVRGNEPRVPRPAAKAVLSADAAPVRLDDDLQTVADPHLAHNG